jgi:uncharacterized protein (DUF924 family)
MVGETGWGIVPGDAPDAKAAEVLVFWFGAIDGQAARPEWFRKDAAFDSQIRQRFGEVIEAALAAALTGWDATPSGALARIVVLDQFTRNAFRDQARAFAGDAPALAAARAMLGRGWDLVLPPVQRSFVYLPFEHAEDLAAQDESIRLFSALASTHPPSADALAWAHKHRDIVVRFGRYPHRNEVLGRTSTAEELAFLAEPGSRF